MPNPSLSAAQTGARAELPTRALERYIHRVRARFTHHAACFTVPPASLGGTRAIGPWNVLCGMCYVLCVMCYVLR